MSDLATQSLTSYILNIYALTFYHSAGSFFIRSHLVLLLSVKAAVLIIRIILKRIDFAILKLTISCIKNIVVLNT